MSLMRGISLQLEVVGRTVQWKEKLVGTKLGDFEQNKLLISDLEIRSRIPRPKIRHRQTKIMRESPAGETRSKYNECTLEDQGEGEHGNECCRKRSRQVHQTLSSPFRLQDSLPRLRDQTSLGACRAAACFPQNSLHTLVSDTNFLPEGEISHSLGTMYRYLSCQRISVLEYEYEWPWPAGWGKVIGHFVFFFLDRGRKSPNLNSRQIFPPYVLYV